MTTESERWNCEGCRRLCLLFSPILLRKLEAKEGRGHTAGLGQEDKRSKIREPRFLTQRGDEPDPPHNLRDSVQKENAQPFVKKLLRPSRPGRQNRKGLGVGVQVTVR